VQLSAEVVRRMLARCETVFVVHRVYQVRRKGHGDDLAFSAEAVEAAARLAKSGLATGGMRAIDWRALYDHLEVYVDTFPALYKDALERAVRGARRRRNCGAHQCRRAEVQQLAEGAALFRAYLSTQEPNERVRRELLERAMWPCTKCDDRLLFYVGDPKAGSKSFKGKRAGACAAFVDAARRQFVTFLLSEYYTSQKCWQCGAQLVKTRGHSYRFWRCPHSLLNGTGQGVPGRPNMVMRGGKQRHVAEENKDVVAALSMLQIGIRLMIDGARPAEWCANDVRDYAEAAASSSSSTTTSSSSSSSSSSSTSSSAKSSAKAAGNTQA
jgi:hypothetical protein